MKTTFLVILVSLTVFSCAAPSPQIPSAPISIQQNGDVSHALAAAQGVIDDITTPSDAAGTDGKTSGKTGGGGTGSGRRAVVV
ncbi:hypothetical protein P691DRAFT_812132 [Macrolepiota fuliginosa MF-IS2]|uniref:Uncharacterized protein n=1 Tax=Macrolepiota fuliginosa MF-IS2 TaxID=1400762 RepID=A0A9P5X1I0_9AGAR|nr:hypothetical protein P691DRAFT_812132 [Macrolepiota fuliginosa MF-IS2]